MLAPPNDDLYEVRHPAPQEIALLNGLMPQYVEHNKNFSYRFELGAVGQLASPLQGAWTLACALHQIAVSTNLVEQIPPEVVVARLALEVIESRFQIWPNQIITEHTEAFVREFRIMSGDFVDDPQPFAKDEGNCPTTEDMMTEDDDEVAKALSHLLPSFNEVDTTTGNDPYSIIDEDHKDESAAVFPVPCTDTSVAVSVESCTDASAVEPRLCPEASAVGDNFRPCTVVQSEFHPCSDRSEVHSPKVGLITTGHASPEIPKPSGLSRPVELQPFAEPPSKKPRVENSPTRDPYGLAGGMQFSASSEAIAQGLIFDRATMLPQVGTAVPHEPLVHPTAPWTHPAVVEEVESDQIHAPDLPTDEHELIPDTLDFAIAKALCNPEDNILIWIGHEGSPLCSVSVPQDTTVGQVLQAELIIGCDKNLTKAIDAVGSPLSATNYVYDKQIILIRTVESSPEDKCPFHRGQP